MANQFDNSSWTVLGCRALKLATQYHLFSFFGGGVWVDHLAVVALDMRRARYRGHTKTHLQDVLTAAALNLLRVGDWLAGAPRSRTRLSRLAALVA